MIDSIPVLVCGVFSVAWILAVCRAARRADQVSSRNGSRDALAPSGQELRLYRVKASTSITHRQRPFFRCLRPANRRGRRLSRLMDVHGTVRRMA